MVLILSDFAFKLLTLCEESDKPIKISATELMTKLNDLNLTSTKDLAIKMGRFGMKSRPFRVGNKVGRYYIFDKEKIQKYIKIVDISTIPIMDGEITIKEELNNDAI